MATIEEMAEVVNDLYRNSGEMAGIILNLSARRFSSIIMDLLYHAMLGAEYNGEYYNDGYGADNELCTCWSVGDYTVVYLTDDEDFNAEMLTEDMMDDLIIEEA